MVFAYPRAALGSTQRVFVSENFLQDGWPGASRDLDEFIVWSVSAMVSALQVVEVIPPWWREARWWFAIVQNPYREICFNPFHWTGIYVFRLCGILWQHGVGIKKIPHCWWPAWWIAICTVISESSRLSPGWLMSFGSNFDNQTSNWLNQVTDHTVMSELLVTLVKS